VKLSIIIPVYRNADTLQRCMESIVAQSFTDWEAILVDDGSPDDCPQQCDQWARSDSRISVVHKMNGGLSDARNSGLQKAKGQFVTFVDADDFIDTDTYEQVLPLAETCDLLEFPIFCHYGSTRQLLMKPTPRSYNNGKDYWLSAQGYNHSYACNKIYRRPLFDGVTFPVGRVFEDMATLPLLVNKATSIRTTDRGCYYYTDNPEGITRTATGKELSQLLESHLLAMEQWCDDRYYMHVLNIQLDVCRLTGNAPLLRKRSVSLPSKQGLGWRLSAKALLLRIIGIKGLCLLQKTIRHH